MQISNGSSITHLPAADRRQEFVAVLEVVVSQVGAQLESLALYVMVAAFWGVVLFVGMGTFLGH